MTALSIAVAAAALLAWALLLWLGARTRAALLRAPADPPAETLPRLTAVVPCRDEERGVEAALRSLLAQDLADLEVVAVDDRSTDATGAILERLAAADRRLRVVHVEALPPGWLGKNHACAAGARRATGGWLLFTDADVVFAPDALRRALALAVGRGLGHLSLVPRFVAPGFVERAFVSAFASLLAPAVRVWDLPRAGTRAYFGAGAFNLVRRADYDRAGGHARIALEVVDDVKLGLLLRRSGVPQGVGDSEGLVAVRWQDGFLRSVLGLVKNAFAALEYRTALAVAASGMGLLAGAAPLAIAFLASSPAARVLAALALAASAIHHGISARRLAGGTGAEGLLMPLCVTLLSGVVIGSALAARWRRGVVWRGTHYPLEHVRAGCLREAELPASDAAGWPAPAEGSSARTERAAVTPRARLRW